MKPRELSTRERAIYDRLTLHARAALTTRLAILARQLATHGFTGPDTSELAARLGEAFAPGWCQPNGLPAQIADSLGGAL